MRPPTLDTRTAGVLLHPTSLPGSLGSGDLGPQAFRFADALHSAGIRWWQMLPITPADPRLGNSPYSSDSAFAGSPALVSPELLVDHRLLSRSDLASPPKFAAERVDFPRVLNHRSTLLQTAFANISRLTAADQRDLARFCSANAGWLEDYALFRALKHVYRGALWSRWPVDLRFRRPHAIAAARARYADAIRFHSFVQWLFDRQWSALKKYCNDRGIGLIGDVPIFVAHDSADVWAHPELFLLDRLGNPTVVSGYPADVFAPLGQKWDHPHYRWPAHQKTGFAWWLDRFGRTLAQFDAVRIDHFLGFHRVWAVPARAPNAVRGRWLTVPGDKLFTAVRKRFNRASIIAEDLGRPTRKAIALRDKFGFPGMRILQFAFGKGQYHRPHTFVRNCVAYTGTHDNDTIAGWFSRLRADRTARNGEMARVVAYVGPHRGEMHWNFIRALFASGADITIVPVQDLLGLGSEHRMNVPGTPRGNWSWRMTGPLPTAVLKHLRTLNEATGRYPHNDGE